MELKEGHHESAGPSRSSVEGAEAALAVEAVEAGQEMRAGQAGEAVQLVQAVQDSRVSPAESPSSGGPVERNAKEAKEHEPPSRRTTSI